MVSHALGRTGDAGLRAAAETRRRGGVAGAAAATMLASRDALAEDALGDAERTLAAADSMLALCLDGELAQCFEGLSTAEQVELVRGLGDSGHPDVLVLLDAIAEEHPDRKVTKAAGKARLRLRTAGG
jgi:hypothetical protein